MPTFKDQMETLWRGERPRSPVGQLLGFELIEYEEGSAFFSMEVIPKHWNLMGTVHGGVLSTLAEAAMGVAFATTLKEDESFTVVEMQINFLRPIWSGRVDARAKVLDRGRTLGMVECELHNEDQKLIAKATCTCTALRGDAAAGR